MKSIAEERAISFSSANIAPDMPGRLVSGNVTIPESGQEGLRFVIDD